MTLPITAPEPVSDQVTSGSALTRVFRVVPLKRASNWLSEMRAMACRSGVKPKCESAALPSMVTRPPSKPSLRVAGGRIPRPRGEVGARGRAGCARVPPQDMKAPVSTRAATSQPLSEA